MHQIQKSPIAQTLAAILCLLPSIQTNADTLFLGGAIIGQNCHIYSNPSPTTAPPCPENQNLAKETRTAQDGKNTGQEIADKSPGPDSPQTRGISLGIARETSNKAAAALKKALDETIFRSVKQATHMCLALSLENVSPSVLDHCALAREKAEDLKKDPENPHLKAETLDRIGKIAFGEAQKTQGIEAALKISLLSPSLGSKARQAYLTQTQSLLKGDSNLKERRKLILDRLTADLTTAMDACKETQTYEKEQIQAEYSKIPSENPLGIEVVQKCRKALREARHRKTPGLTADEEEIVRHLETTPRFLERVRGMTLLSNPKSLNETDLHEMTKQGFDTLAKRIKLSTDFQQKAPQTEQLQELINSDPDFANEMACHLDIEIAPAKEPKPDKNSASEVHKREILREFVQSRRFDLKKQAQADLSYLIGSGQYQRAVWLHKQLTGSDALRDHLDASVKDKVFSTKNNPDLKMKENKGLGVNESHIVTLPNGIKGIYKPFKIDPNETPEKAEERNHEGERAAYEIDTHLGLGLVPSSHNITIDGRKGSFQAFATQAQTPGSTDNTLPMGQGVATKSWKLKLLDWVLGNPDRVTNTGNFMRTIPEKHEVAIDNELSFTPQTLLFYETELKEIESMLPPTQEERQAMLKRLVDLSGKLPGMKLHDRPELDLRAHNDTPKRITILVKLLNKCPLPDPTRECARLAKAEFDNVYQLKIQQKHRELEERRKRRAPVSTTGKN